MREDSLEKFKSNIAYPYIDEALMKAFVDFYEQKGNRREHYLDVLKRVFLAVKKYAADTGQEVAYISFALLRTNFLYAKYFCDVHVYDKEWYFNDHVEICEMETFDFFQSLEGIKKYLLSESKKFVGKVNVSDVDNIISEYIHPVAQIFIKMFNYVLLEATECIEYVEIAKADSFRIYVGELYERHYNLFEETKDRLSFSQLANRIKYNEICRNLDVRNSEFADMALANADLQYSDFRGSTLKNIDFSNALLEGCIFANCNLAGANLNKAKISEANFQNADLRKANLSGVVSTEGIFEDEDWDFCCKLPLILHETDMREAAINNATLHKVDFTQAKLDRAIFSDSDLLHCKFKKEQLLNIELTESQRSQIIIV